MGAKLLVVDDEPDIAETVALALELSGHTVSTAGTGREALEKIGAEHPDLVILDMYLPDVSGVDVVRWMKERQDHKRTPIILITAMTQKNEQEAFKREQVDYCMTKPFDLGQLEAKVNEILGGDHA